MGIRVTRPSNNLASFRKGSALLNRRDVEAQRFGTISPFSRFLTDPLSFSLFIGGFLAGRRKAEMAMVAI